MAWIFELTVLLQEDAGDDRGKSAGTNNAARTGEKSYHAVFWFGGCLRRCCVSCEGWICPTERAGSGMTAEEKAGEKAESSGGGEEETGLVIGMAKPRFRRYNI